MLIFVCGCAAVAAPFCVAAQTPPFVWTSGVPRTSRVPIARSRRQRDLPAGPAGCLESSEPLLVYACNKQCSSKCSIQILIVLSLQHSSSPPLCGPLSSTCPSTLLPILLSLYCTNPSPHCHLRIVIHLCAVIRRRERTLLSSPLFSSTLRTALLLSSPVLITLF
jgi:hypothetical protein